jgi:hypothetical protein
LESAERGFHVESEVPGTGKNERSEQVLGKIFAKDFQQHLVGSQALVAKCRFFSGKMVMAWFALIRSKRVDLPAPIVPSTQTTKG